MITEKDDFFISIEAMIIRLGRNPSGKAFAGMLYALMTDSLASYPTPDKWLVETKDQQLVFQLIGTVSSKTYHLKLWLRLFYLAHCLAYSELKINDALFGDELRAKEQVALEASPNKT